MSGPDRLAIAIDELVEERVRALIPQVRDELRMQMPELEGALRVSKAAKTLDISETALRRLIADGAIETIELSGVTHVRTSEIARYLDDLTANARRDRMAEDARARRADVAARVRAERRRRSKATA